MVTSTAVKVFNRVGRGIDSLGFESRRRDAASQLSDFLPDGDGEWQLLEPLQRLLASLEEQAFLTPIGRLAARRHISDLLANFARLQSVWRETPEISDTRLGRCVFITGLPRTGSTLLHALLSRDPDIRVPLSWELMRPPLTSGDARSNIRYTERRLGWAQKLVPGFQAIHPLGPELPDECLSILAYAFRSILFHTVHHVPDYEDWLESDSQTIAYEFHKQFLRHLQYFGQSGNWVLKAPGHMFGLAGLRSVYPDAVIVQTHRDPVRVAGSLASHTTVLRAAFSDHYSKSEIAEDWLERWWTATDAMLDWRKAGNEPVIDVFYAELMSDPVATVGRLYESLGWEFSDRARGNVKDYLANNPQRRFGPHRYQLEDYGLTAPQILERTERYRAAFPIEPEPQGR